MVALLILPKAILLVRALVRRDSRNFGGAFCVALTAFLELVFTSMLAPVHMMFQSRSVLQILLGADSAGPQPIVPMAPCPSGIASRPPGG
ncbi:hypothetical protein V6L77_22850 [Pannonibacter sp. Pt2-lr]